MKRKKKQHKIKQSKIKKDCSVFFQDLEEKKKYFGGLGKIKAGGMLGFWGGKRLTRQSERNVLDFRCLFYMRKPYKRNSYEDCVVSLFAEGGGGVECNKIY